MIIYMTICSLGRAKKRLLAFLKCQHTRWVVGWTLLEGCNLGEMSRSSG